MSVPCTLLPLTPRGLDADGRLFLSHNTDLGPPYRVLVDTNFINFSIQNKIELVQGMMDCLLAKSELEQHLFCLQSWSPS